MPHVPFLGRLYIQQYVALFSSFLLVFLEGFIRIITLALPSPIIHLFYRLTRRLFNSLSSPHGRRARNKNKAFVNRLSQASDFLELCELFGYHAEEHIVQTGDGYLLGIHRLGWRKGEEEDRVNAGKGSTQKKIIYLHHGLLMNSEVWVCLTEAERCLPFLLVERGYDVWLGNNRGNKYSKKSLKRGPNDMKFWDFSIDQFAFHDIPDSIDYILDTTSQSSLSYVGFSQGTAQAFAALSIHPVLNTKVDVFIALAPAMAPPGMHSPIVDSLVKASPDVLFLAFGRRALLTSATMWQAILYQPIFVRLIDWSLSFLFGWQGRNIPPHQKLASYPHLYSFTSTKSVVHWFQIIRNGKFQMYDDEIQSPLAITNGAKYYKPAKFPTRNIKTPIVLVYGGSDSLVDINVMLKELPKHTVAKEIPHYEHLDFLWAGDVHTQVFPYVFDALDATHHPQDEQTRRQLVSEAMSRRSSSHDKKDVLKNHIDTEDDLDDETDDGPVQLRKISENVRFSGGADMSRPASKLAITSPKHSPHASQSAFTDKTTTSRPEGWWSSDEVGGTEPSTPAQSGTDIRPTSAGTQKSPTQSQIGFSDGNTAAKDVSFGQRGISLSKGAAVGGLSSDIGHGSLQSQGSSSGTDAKRKKRLKR